MQQPNGKNVQNIVYDELQLHSYNIWYNLLETSQIVEIRQCGCESGAVGRIWKKSRWKREQPRKVERGFDLVRPKDKLYDVLYQLSCHKNARKRQIKKLRTV